ncbi:MAG: selenide, water dikinase SelD [Bacteroidia bacterium]|nr:selenide, water dikinase SelD [Bacteroidia bacterium]
MSVKEKNIRLTQYSHGAGCGCKISPAVLDQILKHSDQKKFFDDLIVGNSEKDDAAVIDIGNNIGIVSTTDFFMPIVDDPFDFGQIASVNAVSDIYAMGATPLMAIAILGWPINLLPADVANLVVSGARNVCNQINIPLAGGHSIDSPEPIFGLAVTGRVHLPYLKRNGGAQIGSSLYLTKPLGVGILTTAEKKQKLLPEHIGLAKKSMLQVNAIGAEYAKLDYVEAMTDVTGFGLGGHLTELCEASDLSASLHPETLPLLSGKALETYIEEDCVPGGTYRNFNSYGNEIDPLSKIQKALICDPQTSGGLLVAVSSGFEAQFEDFNTSRGAPIFRIGTLITKEKRLIRIVS